MRLRLSKIVNPAFSSWLACGRPIAVFLVAVFSVLAQTASAAEKSAPSSSGKPAPTEAEKLSPAGPEVPAPSGSGGIALSGTGKPAPTGTEKPAPEKLPAVAEKTAQLERHAGLLTIYLDRVKGKVWLELGPPDARGEVGRFLYVEGLVAGLGSNPVGLDRGQLGESRVVVLRRVGARLLVEEVNLRFRALGAPPAETQAVRESFAASVLWGGELAALDPDKLGRVMSLFSLAAFGTFPLGALQLGALAGWLGPLHALLAVGSILAALAIAFARTLPRLRALDDEHRIFAAK